MACFPFRAFPVLVFGLLCGVPELWPQERAFAVGAELGDPAALIGLSVEALWAQYGPPRSVYAVRGRESWQDDVVFVYAPADFYVYRDRVWQLGLRAAYDIRVGDPRGIISLVFGEGLEDQGNYLVCPLFGWSWPLTLRFNIDDSGLVSAIYIYRSDF